MAKTFSFEEALPKAGIAAPAAFSFEDAFKPLKPVVEPEPIYTPEERMASDPALAQPSGSGLTAISDIGKLFGAGAVKSIAGAPEAVQQAATVASRETATKPSEILNFFADPRLAANKMVETFGFNPIFEMEKPVSIVPNELVKRQSAALDQTFTKGKIPALTALTNYGSKVSKELEDSVSPEMKEAMAATEPTGNLVKAFGSGDFSQISFGKDPSAQGLIGQAAKVFGSSGTALALGLLTRSPTVGGAAGFGMAGSEGVDTAKEYIEKMSDQELNQNSEYFRNLIVMGYDKKTAREMTIDKASSTAAFTQGLVGALGGQFTTKLVSGQLDKTLIEAARKSLGKIAENRAARIAGGVTIGAAEEGLQELAEGIATDLSIDRSVVREIGVDSFANLVLGAIGGSGPGAVRGAIAKEPEQPPTGEATPSTPATFSFEEAFTPAPSSVTVEAAPAEFDQATALPPASESQDTQAMIDEFRGMGIPPAESVATPAVMPEAAPTEIVAPEAVTPAIVEPEAVPAAQLPEGNVWENIQNRDRSTPASIAQMAKIANEPDYSRVSMSRDYGTGAPIVVGNRLAPEQFGREDTVTGADGKKVPIQYAVIDASEALPSHNADGTKNPEYVQPNFKAFRAITNGRVAGLQAAYRQGTAEDYRTALLSDDLHGISKEVIESMPNPMLVRLMQMQDVNKNTGDISNTGAGLSLNVVEQAKNDTNRIDLGKVSFTDAGDITPQTVRDFIKAMPDTERGNLIDKQGNPTKQAVERVDAAIFQQAYNNDKLTELAFQARDEEARNIVRALNMAASKAIRLSEAGDYDVRPLVNEAVEMAINARRNNISLSDAAAQADMTANPLANEIVQMFANNPRSAKAIGQNLTNLFDNAFAEGSKSGEDMFGAVPKRPVDQLIKDSFAKEPDLFAEPVKPAVEKPAEKKPADGEVVENPKAITKPDPKWNTVRTGEAVTLMLYQGRGESRAKIYTDVQVPVAGKAEYYAPTGKDAANYGAVKKYKITLENPLVIKTDDEWRDFVKKKAGWKYLNPFGLDEKEITRLSNDLKKAVLDEGYDSLVIKPSTYGDDAKTLLRVFAHDQVVAYKEQKAAVPVEEKPATEFAVTETVVEPKQFKAKKSVEQIAKEIEVMNKGSQVSEWLVENAPNEAAQAIAERLTFNIKAIEDSGVPVVIQVLNGAQRNPYYGASGIAINSKKEISYFRVQYNGVNSKGQAEYEIGTKEAKEGKPTSGRPTGTRYSTLMHELLHVISQVQLDALIRRNFKGPEKVIYNELRSIYNAVKDKVESDKRTLPRDQWHPMLKQVGTNNNRGVLEDIHELFVRSLTEKSVQSYLSGINMGKKTALTKLMEVFRKVIGLNPDYQTALDRIMIVSEQIFAQTPADMKRLTQTEGYDFPTMKKEELSEEKPATAPNYLGKPVEASWAFPEDKFIKVPGAPEQSIDKLLYIFQDKQIDLKRAQEGIAKAAGEITDNINAYDKEQLFHGKVATGIRNFLLNELMPAIKKIKEFKLTTKDMQDYLLARHAEERNNRMNELNKLDPRTGKERKTPWELQDRASGMSTADARKYLADLAPAKKKSLETIGEMFDKMITGTQNILVESGSESQATIDAWNEAYEHYMPLFRVEEDFNNGGNRSGLNKGFNVSNPFSKRAMGSAKEVQNIVTNLIKQRERALIRAEKLTVSKALYGLFLMNPNPDIALPVNPDAIKSKDALITELQGLGYENAEEIANNLMEEPKSRYISKNKVIDKDTGLPTSDTEESVKLRIDSLARFGDNVLTLRIDGKNRYIFFNQENPNAVRMAASLKSLDTESLGSVMSIVAKGTRWFANVNTQYNPIFAAVNLIRDVGAAQLNLTTTPLAGKQAQVTADIFPAMRGIFKVIRAERGGEVGGDSDMEKAFREFRQEGGQTGYRDAIARKESEQSIVDDMLAKKSLSGNALQAMKSVFGALSDFNDTLENSIRLSAYIQASKPKSDGGLGLSKQQSAIIAKNLTVNFDKKGQISANVNALYAFFNASVQGTARLATTLTGPKGKAIIGGGILLGSIQSILLAAAGFEDDEPPEFVKQRNFVIPTPDGNYLTIPYPLGFNLLPNIGRITTEFMISGGKDPAKRAGDMLGSVADAFSPIGSSGLSTQTIAPTVLDPLLAIEANKDAFGRPIYKEDRATNPTPGYLRSRENASEMSKGISYFLNLASGGGKYSKGLLSPTADEIDYVIGQVTGGLGREIMKTGQTIKAAGTGEDLPAYRVPLLGRFYGETESNAAESQRFYNNITKMADHENEIKGRIKNKESVASYYRDNPQARFYQQANTIENQINALNRQKKEFIEKDLPKDRIKRIENQKAAIMKRFNEQLKQYEE